MLNVDQATISRWERGAQMPDAAMQNRLRDMLFRGRAISDARLMHFVRSASGLMAVIDADGHFVAVSESARRVVPLGRENIRDIMTPSIEEAWNTAIASGFFRGEVASMHLAVEVGLVGGGNSMISGSWHPVTLADGSVVMLAEGKEIDSATYQALHGQGLRVTPLEEIL